MADFEQTALMYVVEISRPADGYGGAWWATSNTGTPGQVVAALRELADRVAHDHRAVAATLRCWYSYLVQWPDGIVLDSCDGVGHPDTAVAELRRVAAGVFAETRRR
ncbi:hypothetical protein NLM24_00040 [Nocardia zapadnayensis]|uniref:hypothetical protein n=1 Tax=Nocardia rhamnosiphila TaxID=426716 RepID=UPI0022470CAB|nr:hypothetical protein [Nocardia zapadnayensis]MCX0269130.1 hypothetical protein [Nocardia zapadnayensis]